MPREHVAEQAFVPFEISCPYCFMKFKHDEVHFRAATNSHYRFRADGNRVVDTSPVEDKKLAEYWKTHGGRSERTRPAIDPSGQSTGDEYIKLSESAEVEYDNKNVLVAVTDEFGNRTDERLCPYCHNILHKSAGKYQSYCIAFAGDTAVGKTIYMVALLHMLSEQFVGSFRSILMPTNDYIYNRYMEGYDRPLFGTNGVGGGTLPDHTRMDALTEPLIFELQLGIVDTEPTNVITLSFYDTAGEGINDADYMREKAKQFRYADAYLYLVDPLQTAMAESIVMNNPEAERNYIKNRDSAKNILTRFFTNGIEYKRKPTAIVLTKSDFLRTAPNLHNLLPENSRMFSDFIHNGAVDLEEIDKVHEEVKRFFMSADPLFANMVDLSFSTYRFFGVSALGGPTTTVSAENGRKVKRMENGQVNPIRVTEPFLWLLNQLGLIDTLVKQEEQPEKVGFFKKLFKK